MSGDEDEATKQRWRDRVAARAERYRSDASLMHDSEDAVSCCGCGAVYGFDGNGPVWRKSCRYCDLCAAKLKAEDDAIPDYMPAGAPYTVAETKWEEITVGAVRLAVARIDDHVMVGIAGPLLRDPLMLGLPRELAAKLSQMIGEAADEGEILDAEKLGEIPTEVASKHASMIGESEPKK